MALGIIAIVDVSVYGTDDPGEIAYLTMFVIADIVLPAFPLFAGTAMMALSIVGTLIDYPFSPSPLVTAMASLVILGYLAPRLGAICGCTIIASLLALLPILHYDTGTNLYGMVNMCAFSALCYFVGYALRWKTQASQNAIAQSRLTHLRYNMFIATSMHDSTSAKLTNIMHIAQTHMLDATSPSEKKDWNEINDFSFDTLRDVHRIIDLLDGSQDSDGPADPARSFREQVEATAAIWKQDLQRNGFHGEMTISGILDVDDSDITRIVLSVMEEMFRNIARHADANSPYTFTISCRQSELVIAESNACHREFVPIIIPHGKVLRLHRKQIESVGGTFTTSRQDGRWTMMVSVPVDFSQGR